MLGKPGPIFRFIVLLLQIYGTRFYALLGFFGCSLIISLIFFLAGIIILGTQLHGLEFGAFMLNVDCLARVK